MEGLEKYLTYEPNMKETKLNECYFIPNNKSSSATICINCGKEKMLHTIGKGIKATTIILQK